MSKFEDETLQASASYFDRSMAELNIIKAKGVDVKNGVPYKFRSGATYTGQWMNNMRHGYGKQIWTDGASYEGQWNKNVATGKGRFTHSDGDVYIGQWSQNKASGMGTYYHRGSTTYRGEWRSDIQDGYGTESWVEGA